MVNLFTRSYLQVKIVLNTICYTRKYVILKIYDCTRSKNRGT